MDIQKLFDIQETLNNRIMTEHQLTQADLFQEQQLALLVELGELANETRCFKYWSRKQASERGVILEEYVDGLHFVLTLGLALGFRYPQPLQSYVHQETLTGQFLVVMETTHRLQLAPTEENYHALMEAFLALGQQLGFSHEEIEAGYLAKNKVNHERQDVGY
ncbi:dUTP diphosphatase [Alkalihalobacillus oceani]|uniref:dUTP diphosphatase n=1 Tax=Halalkalibacter oceani TaxID=1653776 RepID=A0A9X2DUY4_9BACI|nr:dUTP diphosphatase [Halalkalibacter oceani]MCM3716007.1 dUTP diphosphatase [Halalkalibacter oceani]